MGSKPIVGTFKLMPTLSNWLAHQTVNLVPSGHDGSSPSGGTLKIYS